MRYLKSRSSTMRNLIKGASTVLDVFPRTTIYPIKKSDMEKLCGDWHSIANDFRNSEITNVIRGKVEGVLVGKKPIIDNFNMKKLLITRLKKSLKEPIGIGESVSCRILSEPEGLIGVGTSEKRAIKRRRLLGGRRKYYKARARTSGSLRKNWGPPVRSDTAGT